MNHQQFAAIILASDACDPVKKAITKYYNDNAMLEAIARGQLGWLKEHRLFTKANKIADMLNGNAIDYYDNGQVYYEREYVNGKLYGNAIVYYKNGQVYYEREYVNGDLK